MIVDKKLEFNYSSNNFDICDRYALANGCITYRSKSSETYYSIFGQNNYSTRFKDIAQISSCTYLNYNDNVLDMNNLRLIKVGCLDSYKDFFAYETSVKFPGYTYATSDMETKDMFSSYARLGTCPLPDRSATLSMNKSDGKGGQESGYFSWTEQLKFKNDTLAFNYFCQGPYCSCLEIPTPSAKKIYIRYNSGLEYTDDPSDSDSWKSIISSQYSTSIIIDMLARGGKGHYASAPDDDIWGYEYGGGGGGGGAFASIIIRLDKIPNAQYLKLIYNDSYSAISLGESDPFIKVNKGNDGNLATGDPGHGGSGGVVNYESNSGDFFKVIKAIEGGDGGNSGKRAYNSYYPGTEGDTLLINNTDPLFYYPSIERAGGSYGSAASGSYKSFSGGGGGGASAFGRGGDADHHNGHLLDLPGPGGGGGGGSAGENSNGTKFAGPGQQGGEGFFKIYFEYN